MHTRETSFYTPLNNLLDAAGHTLKPHVRCIMQLKNIGAGMPDGSLFTQDQFNKKTHSPKDISSPVRGMVEIKGLAEAVDDTATGAQVDKYWTGYSGWCWSPITAAHWKHACGVISMLPYRMPRSPPKIPR